MHEVSLALPQKISTTTGLDIWFAQNLKLSSAKLCGNEVKPVCSARLSLVVRASLIQWHGCCKTG